MPTVSICIPTYRRPALLREAIASVLEQTHEDVEVIVSDDAGDAKNVVTSFRDARVRYRANPRTLGMARNWEAALELARGDYVGLLMDDDRLLPAYVETLHAVMEDQPEVGIAFTNHYFDRDGQITRRDDLIAPGIYRNMLIPLMRSRPIAICATLMRRQILPTMLPLPDIQSADIAMMMRAAIAGVVFAYVRKPLMIYRVHDTNLSGRVEFREHALALWDAFEFPDGSEEEAVRRDQLATALTSSITAATMRRDFAAARAQGERLRALEVLGLPARSRAVAGMTRSDTAMRLARGATRIRQRSRATTRS